MAKSVRASVSKRNSAKLRATVFGPADNARTARLSAKLQELASQPKPTDNEMKVDGMCVAHDCQSPRGILYILIDIQIQMSRANPRKPRSLKQVKVIILLNNTLPLSGSLFACADSSVAKIWTLIEEPGNPPKAALRNQDAFRNATRRTPLFSLRTHTG